jgi:hypothetical protein
VRIYDNCPHCSVSLQGDPIPEKHLPVFNALDAKPGDYGWVTHFRREIGVEVLGGYDGVLYWKCPDCDGVWHRWGSPAMRAAAERAEPDKEFK